MSVSMRGKPKPKGSGKLSQKIKVTDLQTNITTTYDSISEASKVLNILQSSISGYFIRNQTKPYKKRYIFKLVQVSNILKDICSLEDTKASRSVSRYLVNQHAVIVEFVDKFPMLTRKQLDYLDWKKLIQLKAERAQDTPEGRLLMEKIKNGMNRGR